LGKDQSSAFFFSYGQFLCKPFYPLFIRLVLQNGGRLSKNKRKMPEFAVLTPEEITGLEAALGQAFAD